MSAPMSQQPSFSAGHVIGGRYRLEEPVGRGGMAMIWRAVHLDLNRPVAVKFLTIQGGDAQRVRERFLREARIAAAIRHRNVVDITDFGTTDDGRPFMVMELLEGQSLAERMAGSTHFTLPDVVRIGARTLSGIGAVHDSGIIHRDLKPENVFLVRDADGVCPKLLDFGISRSLDDELESVVPSSDNILAGTPQYMAPEQARGVKDVDQRADLWSVGVILYEMITGKMPFDAENPGDLIVMIMTEEPTPVEKLRPDLGEPLAEFVRRALAKDRKDRFRSAREMRQALLHAANATASALELAVGAPSVHSSISEHPTLQPHDLRDAVGSSYEPGDSAMQDLRDASSQPVRWSADTITDEPAPPAAEADTGRSSRRSAASHPSARPAAASHPSARSAATSRPSAHLATAAPARRRQRTVALAVGASVTLLAGAAVVMLADGGPGAAAEEAGTAASAPGADADEVVVTLRRLPREASVTVDGQPNAGAAIRLPRDGEEHLVEVNAAGYEPWAVRHRAVDDRTYDVELLPLQLDDDVDATRDGAGGAKRPRTRPDELLRDPGF